MIFKNHDGRIQKKKRKTRQCRIPYSASWSDPSGSSCSVLPFRFTLDGEKQDKETQNFTWSQTLERETHSGEHWLAFSIIMLSLFANYEHMMRS